MLWDFHHNLNHGLLFSASSVAKDNNSGPNPFARSVPARSFLLNKFDGLTALLRFDRFQRAACGNAARDDPERDALTVLIRRFAGHEEAGDNRSVGLQSGTVGIALDAAVGRLACGRDLLAVVGCSVDS